MKKLFFALLLCAVCLHAAKPKYIFLFIGDGMSTPQRMIAEEFAIASGHGKLQLNHMQYHATTRTASANSLVTDSAAAATAIACGEKTNNGRIGVGADGSQKLVSCAEVARDAGRKVGIVTSVTINHATPAGFYAHRSNRSLYYQIGLDLIASGFDFFGGGGFGSKQEDKTDDPMYKGNLFELAAQAGYKVVHGRDGFAELKKGDGKVLALGREGALDYQLDYDGTVPSLKEYVEKAVEMLEDGEKGFFLMVEGGSIDWCGHANDAAGNLNEVLGLDRAVQVAFAFAERHPDETLIVVTGDHETGGMTMGFAGSGYALNTALLTNQKCSTGNFAQKLNKRIQEREKEIEKAKAEHAENAEEHPPLAFDDVREMLTENFGFLFEGDVKKNPMVLKEAEIQALKKAFGEKKLPQAAQRILSEKAGVSWTTGSHSALPVLTTSSGVGAERFTGFLDNTDIARLMKELVAAE